MRALTHYSFLPLGDTIAFSNNEVLAREGIDTTYSFFIPAVKSSSNNEVLAREGIDTVIEVPTSSILTPVTMRY